MKSLYMLIWLMIFSMNLSYALSSGDSTTEFRITMSSRNQHFPAIHGNMVVWEDWRNGNADIYGYDLSMGEEFQIISEPYDQKNPAIHGDRVVWVNGKEIEGCDLLKKESFSIPLTTSCPENPAIYGDVVVWENICDNLGIHVYNLLTHKDYYISGESNTQKFLICSERQQQPAIFNTIIVWTDKEHEGDIIYAYDIETGEKFRVNANRTYFFFDLSQHHPALYENTVIWTEWNGDALYGYDLSTNRRFSIAHSRISDCEKNMSWSHYGSVAPAIYGNIVVWVDCRNGNEDLFGYDLSTGEEFQITFNERSQKSPAIYENIVVWEDNRHGNWDIYGIDISTLPSYGGSPFITSLLIKEYALKIAIMAITLFFLVFFSGNIYYIMRFHAYKNQKSFDRNKFFKCNYIHTPRITILYIALYSFLSILYTITFPSNERNMFVLIFWIGMILLIVLGVIWKTMNPFVYVDDDRITLFRTFPGRWRTYDRQSIKKSTFRHDVFEFHLANGKKVTINPLNAHDDDQVVLLDALKKFFQ